MKISRLKIIVTKMQNSANELNSRMERRRERISELEGRTIEINQSE